MLLSIAVAVAVCAATVVHPSVPSLLVPLVSEDREIWASINFTQSRSSFWGPVDCPEGVVCLPAGFQAALSLRGGNERRTISPTRLIPDHTGWYKEVAGVLAVGPRSDFMKSRMLTLRLRDGVVSTELTAPGNRAPSHSRFPITRGSDQWELTGSLKFTWLQIMNKYAALVVFDFHTVDLILPAKWRYKFSYGYGDRNMRGVLDEINRLHRDCRHRAGIGAQAFSLTVVTSRGNVEVPVVWIEGTIRSDGVRDYCPLSLRFEEALEIRVGRTLLELKDIGLDAHNGLIHVMYKSQSFVAPSPAPNVPSAAFLQYFNCAMDGVFLRCRGAAVTHPTGAAFQIVSHDGSHLQLASLHGNALDTSRIPRGPYVDPEVYLDARGHLFASGECAPRGKESLTVSTDGVRLQFSTSQSFNRDDQCAICLDSLGSERVRQLAVCKHAFHRSCVSRWIAVQRSCPTCRTYTSH